MDRSIRRLGVFLMAIFVALFAQLNYIQIVRAPRLAKQDTQRHNQRNFARGRGTITTADGIVIARSVKSNDRYKYQRLYPKGPDFALITGYLNYNFGNTGLEGSYDDELSGTAADEQKISVRDLFSSHDRTGNLTLTVRSDVQEVARQQLGTRKGSVVVLNPQTGAVLALVSSPTFDPNLLSTHDYTGTQNAKTLLEAAKDQPLLAKAYRRAYPPGSTFKVVTGSTGIESGQVTETTPSYPVESFLDLPQTTHNLSNFSGESCGGTLFTILAKSCNTSFARMGLQLGGPTMVKGAEGFGFNSVPPLDLPAAASTFPVGPFDHSLPTLAFSAIGQGNTRATPLQMALVAAGVANDGVIMTPHVVDQIRDGDGNVIKTIDPTPWRRAVSAQTAALMRQAMLQVVAGGTATRLQIAGLDVGAKTGTAQFGVPGRSHAWVIAWAGPAGQAPTVAIAVLVEDQAGTTEATGGRVAAPIANAVIQEAMKPVPPPPTTTSTTTSTPAGTTTTSTTAAGGH